MCVQANVSHPLVKFSHFKNSPHLDITPIFLKLWILTNFNGNTVFPVAVLVFDFVDFSEGVLHGE
jgi:hypothetical protein